MQNSMHHYSIICVGKKYFQCFAILYNMLCNTNHARFLYDFDAAGFLAINHCIYKLTGLKFDCPVRLCVCVCCILQRACPSQTRVSVL